MTGLDHLLSLPSLPHAGARVGLVCHAASVAEDGRHALEHLVDRTDWTLVRLFGPEHGVDGSAAAGEKVSSGLHPRWDLPVCSLYGEHRIPPQDSLQDLDLMVIDLQDLGVRCYTYASTLDNVLSACAGAGVPVLILDRPTPLQGVVDGPSLDPDLSSFVGQVPLPLVYGWGQGPLARFLKHHRPELAGLDLDVIESDSVCDHLAAPPSPGIPSLKTARIYPMTVWCEAVAGVEVDRGGSRSFQIWCMPDLPVKYLCDTVFLEGAKLLPVENESLPGVAIRITELTAWKPIRNAVRMLHAIATQLGPEVLFSAPGCRPDFFDQLMGTRSVRELLTQGAEPDYIFKDWPQTLPDLR